MSIQSEITRLATAKSDLKTAINAKGGALANESISAYAAAVNSLQTGGCTIATAEVLISARSTSISFTELANKPKMFCIQLGETKTSGSLYFVTSIVANGNSVYCMTMNRKNSDTAQAGYNTNFSWTYKNGTLTVKTTKSNYFYEDTKYNLIYAY